jgi:glutaminyl-tRNA synthetase
MRLKALPIRLCTLEFEAHRPLYDWVLDNISIDCHPQQIEFARLNLEYTVMSKRKLTQLVDEKHVSGWDDPRMPTIAGLRRRGYTPKSVRDFCHMIGVTRADSTVEMGMLEAAIRSDLEAVAPRRMAVLNPLKVVITNYPEDQVETLQGPNHPKDESMGSRELKLTREIFIDAEDFREEANKKYKRLVLGGEVRLRNAYTIRADEIIRDTSGDITEIHCTYDPETLGVNPEGRKIRGVIHWVSASEGVRADVHQYDRLFTVPNPGAKGDFLSDLNPTHSKFSKMPWLNHHWRRLRQGRDSSSSGKVTSVEIVSHQAMESLCLIRLWVCVTHGVGEPKDWSQKGNKSP